MVWWQYEDATLLLTIKITQHQAIHITEEVKYNHAMDWSEQRCSDFSEGAVVQDKQ